MVTGTAGDRTEEGSEASVRRPPENPDEQGKLKTPGLPKLAQGETGNLARPIDL